MNKTKSILAISLAALLAACGAPAQPSSEATSQPSQQSSSQPSQASSQSSSSSARTSSSSSVFSSEQTTTDTYMKLYFNDYVGSPSPSTTTPNKWEKGKTYTWKFKADKAYDRVTMNIGAQMTADSHSSRTLFTDHNGADSSDTFESDAANDGTPRITIKANGVAYEIENHETYSASGLTTSGINYMKLTSFPLKEGENEISMSTHPQAGHRLQVGGDVRLYFAGDGFIPAPEPFVPGDGVFSGLTEFEGVQELLTEKQKAFVEYNGDYAALTADQMKEYASGNANLSSPKPVHVEWTHAPKLENFVYTVEVSQDDTFPAAKTEVYTIDKKAGKQADLYNFLLGGTYHYRVKCTYDDKSFDVSDVESFTVSAQAPRMLNIDGLTNCRDLGGRTLENGSKFKQGLIFRTSALNSNVNPPTHITAEGRRVMKDVLGVKSEIELRGGADGKSTSEASSTTTSDLEDVQFFFAPMAYDGGKNVIFRNIEPIRKIFDILGDTDNYPVIFHCRIGTDRTGAIALLLNGLVGVSEQECYQDYLLSNFGNIGDTRIVGQENSDSIKGYVGQIKAYPGASFAEKCYNFLLSIGVPAQKLDAIINLLTDGEAKTTSAATTIVKDAEGATLTGATLQTSDAFRTAPKYASFAAAGDKATFEVTVAEAGTYDLYLQLQSNDASASLQNALKVTIGENELNLPAASFASADPGLGLGGDFWIPVKVGAAVNLAAGANNIAVESLGTTFGVAFLAAQYALVA